MNLKQLFPTYRTRFRYVERTLQEICRDPAERILNIGSGEGEYDRMIAGFAHALDSCDINEEDVAFARELNCDQPHISYSVEDGHALGFPSAYFDVVTCIEVVEHVAEPTRLIGEIRRVLKPGGRAIITCPNHNYPIVYDPLNRAARELGLRLPVGAYGYGHTNLIREAELEAHLAAERFLVLRKQYLSRHLTGTLESYWPAAFQRLLKANSQNRTARTRRRFVLKPTLDEPPMVRLTDRLIDVDRRWFSHGTRSVGLGYLVEKA